jgi:ATP-dependent helicase/nuclease subunit B
VQARFLCGPAGSGKTFRCLAEIRAFLQAADEETPLVFVAPKQSTFQLERQLLANGSLHGYSRLHILSFERLAKFVFEKFNVAPPKFLNDEGRVMVLRALLLRHENELKLFRGSARRPGFAQEISRLFAEFQQNQLSASRLRTFADDRNLRAELRDKLRDLALLFDRYSSWLADHQLRDGNCLLDDATAMLRAHAKNPAVNFAALWLDGFAEMTPQEMDLLAAILPYCERATLAFCIDEAGIAEKESSWLSIWGAVGNTFQRCRQRAERLGCQIEVEVLPRDRKKSRFGQSDALRHLESHWEGGGPSIKFADTANGALRVVACSNPDAEAVWAAREILKFVRDRNRFRDCAVLVRDLEPYHKTLARTFRRYGIPFFLDRRESVAHHPLAELVRNALRIVTFDWQHEDWFAALKTGFCPAEETEIDRLENESLARGWRGRKWREPIQISEDQALEQRLEQLRQVIVAPFERFREGLSESKFQPDGKQLAGLFRRLWKDLRVEKTLEVWNANETNEVRGGLRPPIHATVRDEMDSWLANVELAFSSEAMPVREWLPVVEAGLANLTVGVIPPTLDEVLIGAVDRARNPELKFSLVLGVNDSVFPTTPASSVVLTDADRVELAIGADLRDRLARERYYGYIAFTRASERMMVSLSRIDSGGSPLNPSPFVIRLRSLFPDLQIEDFNGHIEPGEVESVSELVPKLLEMEKAELADSVRFPGESLSGLLKSLGELREPEPSEKLSAEMAERLYGKAFRTSVSRLEEFAQCPFKFFIRSGLRAGERKLFELDARERGTFQHEVLKGFHEQLVAENKRWRDLTPAQARERVGQIAAALGGDFRDGLLRDSAHTRFAARAMTESLQNFIEVAVSWMREQYEFDPAAVELDFGEEGSPLPAWKIQLDGGRELSLRGRIDRVDLFRESKGGDGTIVVLDYKSSRKKLDPVLVEHGIQLQLPAYLSALAQLSNTSGVFGVEKLVPGGVFYVNLRGQFENGKTREDVLAGAVGKSRRAAYRHTGRFDDGILSRLDSVGAEDQFHYSRNQNGTLRKGSVEALAQADFHAWLDSVESQLRRIGNEIFSGRAQVDPYRKGRETPCDYCDYAATCRIDAWTHRFRMLAARQS